MRDVGIAGPDAHPGATAVDEGRPGVATAVDGGGEAADPGDVETDAGGVAEGPAAHAARQAATVETATAVTAARNLVDITMAAYPPPAPICAVRARA
jgi:hypothetical protein